MTKTIITSYTAFLLMVCAVVGITAAEASEITGTLSSDAANNAPTSGTLGGTVLDANGNSGGGGGSRNGGSGGSSSNAPNGSVLGASTDNTQTTPGFPNAGAAPLEVSSTPTLWSVVVAFFRGIVS